MHAPRYVIVSSATGQNQVVVPPGARPHLVAATAGEAPSRFSINNQAIDVLAESTKKLDKDSLPECIGEQWLIVFGDAENDIAAPVDWTVAWTVA